MIKLTEKQKRFLIKKQDTLTLLELGKIFNCTFQDVYDAYDHMFLTGEYKKLYRAQHDRLVEKLKEARGW